MDAIKGALGMSEQGETWQQEFDQACTMDRTTRLYGFGACFAIGWVLSGISLLFVTQPSIFAAYYSIGNILGICSTFFLFGPCSQLKRMFDKVRIFATLVYLAAIGLTLFVAIKVQSVPLAIVCMLFQFCAMVWYCASYIPYGRRCLQGCVGSVCQV